MRDHQRGAALLLVLWLIAMLTALVGAFAMTARVENLQGRVLTRGLVAQNAARAGMEYALTRVGQSDPRLQWRPDGTAYRWSYAGARVEVKLIDENGKVDLNQADANLLTALIQSAGGIEQQADAAQLASAIMDWRDPDPLTQIAGGAEDPDYASAGLPYGAKDAEFESVAELQQVLGFTPALYAKLEPYLTVYSGRAQPDPAFAAGPVLDAMGLNGTELVAQRNRRNSNGMPEAGSGIPGELPGLVGEGSGTYSIDSRARLSDGRESVLRVVVRAGGGAVPGMAYTPLRWEEGASPR
ncbi:general secretion pathway protein GspK [Lysobacter silvisoli]|uniref:Type II secretion system protein K n=1 Tax=Lysobacter silvisoli TaxID=2293254 RepID=A0A371K0Y9_9GAMM|nr:type II secretion system protein GspK [Lysobacter silvisoli]RDZ27568.1 general secretion pathway protein GspK [Lysobacter silvisoli]